MHALTSTEGETSAVRCITWWRHQMEPFSALLGLCEGNSPVSGEFPTQRPVTRSFDVFFDLRVNKRLSKQSWGWWFETLSRSLWRHRNETRQIQKPKCFLSRLADVFTQSIEARCQVENEDVVGTAPTGDAPTASEWSTTLLPSKVWLILEVWW